MIIAPFCVTFGEPKPWFAFLLFYAVIPFLPLTDNVILYFSLVLLNIFIWSIIIPTLLFYLPQLYRNLINRNLNK